MPDIRLGIQELERSNLSPHATLAEHSRGRGRDEAPCGFRTDFQRDRDRIIHCKAFRRLKHKTQVFLSPESDHYRTRLTHTLEVSQIARTMARALRLNEDLIEAVAMGHDLGHTPFGHAGEQVLNEVCPYGFAHYEQSLRVVDKLEKNRTGLNLTYEVRDGILNHSRPQRAETPEGTLVHIADRIAYINHDIDDAIRGGILSEADLPYDAVYRLGRSSSARIGAMVRSVVEHSVLPEVTMDPETLAATDALREFMFENVYRNSAAKAEEAKAKDMLAFLYEHFTRRPQRLPAEFEQYIEPDGLEHVVCDYIAGMTDRYAIECFKDIIVPRSWQG